MKYKKIFIVLTSFLLLSGCSLTNSDTSAPNITISPTKNTNMNTTPSPSKVAVSPSLQNSTDIDVGLKTANGEIVIKLYQKQAPQTVANFLQKSKQGFYNGLTFHRVIPGFMAQGGDPTGTGTGGNRQKSELNNIPFQRGSLGLARTADTKEFSNDSQFFICFSTQGCQHLTGDYVNFGEVVSGLDVLDKIAQGDKIIEINTLTK